MSEQLYKRVMKGKRTTYEPVIDDEPVTVITFTDAQALTAAGALGTMLLMVFERNMKKMKNGTPGLAERKIRVVQAAILDLYKGTGEAIDDEIADLMATTWDRVMKEVSATHQTEGGTV